MERIVDACADGDGDACDVQLSLEYVPGGHCGATCQDERSDFALRGCALGAGGLCAVAASSILVDACEKEDSPSECDTKMEAAAAAAEAPIAEAYRSVVAACDDGDVDACDAIPGRALSMIELCAAGDYHACADAAEAGDEDAGRKGCLEGLVPVACMHTGLLLRDGAHDRSAEARSFLEQACDGGRGLVSACEAIRRRDFANGCGRHAVKRFDSATATLLAPFEGRDADGQILTLPPADRVPVILVSGKKVQHDVLVDTARAAKDARVLVLTEHAIEPVERATVVTVQFSEAPIPDEVVILDAAGRIRAKGTLGRDSQDRASRSLPRCVATLLEELR